MTHNYSGEITVTENLFLKLADSNFLKFTGLDMYASVEEAFVREDAEIIRNAAEKLEEGERSAVLRLRRADGKLCEVLAVFRKIAADDKVFLHMDISELSGLRAAKKELDEYRREADAFFGILGGVMFKYERSGDFLKIFYVSGSRRHTVYEGSFGKWRNLMQGKVEEESASEFQALCDNMENGGESSFLHTIKLSGLTADESSELYVFRCRRVGEAVLGCVETDEQEKKLFLRDSADDKDSFLDMLGKRAVIERTKRIMSRTPERCSFFIILDLDNFKSVNDTYGHIVGDEVLVRVTKIINDSLDGRGVVGRMGGDEILIVTETIEEQAELRNMLRSIRTKVEWTFKNDSRALNVTCSMGAAAFPDNGRSFGELFGLADKMLYLAKSKGKNRYIIYTPALHGAQPAGPESTLKDGSAKKLSEDKVGIMHRLIEDYLIRRTSNNEKMFSEIGSAFSLSEILMIYEDFTAAFQWTPEGVSSDIDKILFFRPDNAFKSLFNKDGLLVLDGLYKLDGRCPDAEHCLTEKSVKSALFYRIERNEKLSGYVMFARRKQRQMWSEYEIMALSTAAKVFDVSMLKYN